MRDDAGLPLAAAGGARAVLEVLEARVREGVVGEVPVERGEADEERADDVAEVRRDERSGTRAVSISVKFFF